MTVVPSFQSSLVPVLFLFDAFEAISEPDGNSELVMNLALSVFHTVWGLVLLGPTFSRPVVSVCEGFGEVTCTGGPSHAWVNSNFSGQSLPPAGTIFRFVFVWMGDHSTLPRTRFFSNPFVFAMYNSDDAIILW
jgi:hypothetical protein